MEQNKKELLLGQIGTIASWRWRRRTSQPYVDERHLLLGAGKGEHSRILFRKDGVELAELVYNPKNATQMSENMGISLRQVQRYLKQLSDLKLIVWEGGRKNGIWKILDEEYEGFFKRIWKIPINGVG